MKYTFYVPKYARTLDKQFFTSLFYNKSNIPLVKIYNIYLQKLPCTCRYVVEITSNLIEFIVVGSKNKEKRITNDVRHLLNL